jgi:hypothetical protein
VRKPPRSPFPPARERRWFDTTRDAFHRQGPFVGFGGLHSPDPATSACKPPFGVMRCAAGRRSHVALGLARSCTFHFRGASGRVTRSSLRSTRGLTLSCPSPRRLGPRSLAPPLFLERCVRAYSRPGCCLPVSCNVSDVRALGSGLSFPRRDDGHDHLPFLTRHARPLGVDSESGATRRAAQSSVRSGPGAGSSHFRGVARPRYRIDRSTSHGLRHERLSGFPEWRLTCTGLWTERRTCPRRWRSLFGSCQVECARLADADDVPLLGNDQRTPVVIGATASLGTSPMKACRTDQDPCSSASPRRLTAPDGSGCLPPLRRGTNPTSASRSRRPRNFLHWLVLGRNASFQGIASVVAGRARTTIERAGHLLNHAGAFSRIRAWA